tara:strand:+ start:72 stop:593 length:522 start_codon:yes stop_codon:yes gene_type:complete
MVSLFWFSVYKFFGYYLPKSSTPFVGKGIRRFRFFLAKRIFKKVGKNVNLEKGARFGFGKNIEIGDNSGIGMNARIPENTVIGNNVMMGPDCLIFASNHNFHDISKPMLDQGMSDAKQTIISNDVWIGARVIILPGKKIENGVIIAAGSIVTKDLRAYGIYAGNPAKLISHRK